MRLLVTGGAGFIGGELVRTIIKQTDFEVINIDKLTYAGNCESLESIADSKRYSHEQLDICDSTLLANIFNLYQPNFVMHLAAESHVDRSIDGPSDFIDTNIVGTFNLLEAIRHYYESLEEDKRNNFAFIIFQPMKFMVI